MNERTNFLYLHFNCLDKDGQTDGRTNEQTIKQTNKQTNKQTIQPMNGRTKELSFFLSIAIPTLPNLNWLIFELMSFFNNIQT